jgi:hypothetical protein
MKRLLFVDSNVFMYAAGKSHEYKEACLTLLRDVEEKRLKIAIDSEIIQEILYRYHNIKCGEQGLELSWMLLDLKQRVLSVTKEDIEMALFYYKKYGETIEPRDAIHTAVMVNNNISTIISADKHFDTIKEVKRIDPLTYNENRNTYRGW